MMILLTSTQADQVRGPTSPSHALMPRQLKNGNYVLPVAVLNDPAHTMRRNILSALQLIPDPVPGDYFVLGATGATGATGAA